MNLDWVQISGVVPVDGVTSTDLDLSGVIQASGVSVTSVTARLYWSLDEWLSDNDLNSGKTSKFDLLAATKQLYMLWLYRSVSRSVHTSDSA